MRPPPLPSSSSSTLRPPVISITNGTFYRHHPNTTGTPLHNHNHNPALFRNLNFSLPSATDPPAHWYVVGPSLSGKTTFLQLLQGRHLCFPPAARRYPFLSTDAVPHRLRGVTERAIRYVGFSDGDGALGGSVTTSAYLSARYESRRESTDFSLRDFLLGNTSLNPLVSQPTTATTGDTGDDAAIDAALLDRVVRDLRLADLLDLPVAFLSNGQGRRARIARALLASPEVLLLDEPFMGLDPPTVAGLSPLLHGLARRASPRLVLSARPQDPIPDWVTHLAYLRGDCQVAAMGAKDAVLETLRGYVRDVWSGVEREDEALPVGHLVRVGRALTAGGVEGEALMGSEEKGKRSSEDGVETADAAAAAKVRNIGEPVVEMDGCQVQYQGKIALGNWTQTTADGQRKDGLVWTVRRGERWGVFGPNGSGKTTIVSLLCSDHPQTYSLPIKLFGRSRLPEPGSSSKELPLTFWDIQARVGHSSPEIHQHMPRGLSVRQVLENAWADTFRSKPALDAVARAKVDACLRWFHADLNPEAGAGAGAVDGDGDNGLQWADYYKFGELSFSAQRVALFLRAVIKGPDIVVLDEACSGMDDGVRDRCLLFLEHGEAKQYAAANADANATTKAGVGGEYAKPIVDSEAAKRGEVRVPGLSDRQALICISHVREEIPPCVREWICLPEANSGQPARFGVADAPMARDEKSWRAIWGM
ncbi:hypothetical protein SLS62_008428 [Diatrype stigma]|uniref:ABC transporter domain-containing protein n=1 Tax=Diatrype stigma TaxID=117547 RepID=A0AAN9UMJ8_9PEZI